SIVNQNLTAADQLGQSPHATDFIRHLLMMPRRKLVFSAGDYVGRGTDATGAPPLKSIIVNPLTTQGREGQLPVPDPDNLIILISPPPRSSSNVAFTVLPFPSDAANGPMPISCTVTEIKGFKTFHVEYEIETYLNEQYSTTTDPGRGNQPTVPSPILSW